MIIQWLSRSWSLEHFVVCCARKTLNLVTSSPPPPYPSISVCLLLPISILLATSSLASSQSFFLSGECYLFSFHHLSFSGFLASGKIFLSKSVFECDFGVWFRWLGANNNMRHCFSVSDFTRRRCLILFSLLISFSRTNTSFVVHFWECSRRIKQGFLHFWIYISESKILFRYLLSN